MTTATTAAEAALRAELLRRAVRTTLEDRGRKFLVEQTGEVFAGIVETDLAYELRQLGWRLPSGWLSQVEDAGGKVRQVSRFPGGKVRSYFAEPPTLDPKTGRPSRYDAMQRRLLDQYVTIISL